MLDFNTPSSIALFDFDLIQIKDSVTWKLQTHIQSIILSYGHSNQKVKQTKFGLTRKKMKLSWGEKLVNSDVNV